MSARIEFYRTKSNKSIEKTLTENYPNFRSWFLINKIKNLEIDEFKENFDLINFIKSHKKIDFNKTDKKTLNFILVEFIIEYPKSNQYFINFGSTMNKKNYFICDKIVNKTNDKKLKKHWNSITKGRLLENNSAEINIGYLFKNEQTELKLFIKKYFSQNHKTYFRLKKIEMCIGIELLLDAINEIENLNSEIITLIENY